MNRAAALQSLNKIKKVTIDVPEVAPRPSSAGTTSVQYPMSVRDRITIRTNKPVAPPPTEANETWDDRQARIRREGEARRAEQALQRQEQRDLEQRRKWREANDARVKRELESRQSEIINQNMARAEVRQILQDASAEEMNEVLKRVEASHTKGFPAAYQAYLDEVRTEKQ